MESVRSLLHTSGFPLTFWAEVCHTVVYILNRTGFRLIPGNTPFTLWFGFKPSLEHLRIFGCHAYAYIDKKQRTKLDPKSHLCYFLGYCDHTKGYRIWDPVTSQVLIRRDVVFHEQLLYRHPAEQSPSFSTDNMTPALVAVLLLTSTILLLVHLLLFLLLLSLKLTLVIPFLIRRFSENLLSNPPPPLHNPPMLFSPIPHQMTLSIIKTPYTVLMLPSGLKQ